MNWFVLTKLYLQRIPVGIIFEKLEIGAQQLDQTWQNRFLESTVCHPLALKYSPSAVHQGALVQMIIKGAERQGYEVIEDLLEALGQAMAETRSGFGYTTYLVGSMFVSVSESDMFVSDGTTGLRTWSASLRLSEYLWDKPHLLEGKRILELGSGQGLMGLVLSGTCHPRSYTFTDAHYKVLTKLNSNIAVNHNSCSDINCVSNNSNSINNKGNDSGLTVNGNGLDVELPEMTEECHWPARECPSCGKKVCEKILKHFDWEFTTNDSVQGFKYDVLLAADVIYDKHLHILNAIRHIYDVIPSVVGYVANPVRRLDSLQTFRDGIGVVTLHSPTQISRFTLTPPDGAPCQEDAVAIATETEPPASQQQASAVIDLCLSEYLQRPCAMEVLFGAFLHLFLLVALVSGHGSHTVDPEKGYRDPQVVRNPEHIQEHLDGYAKVDTSKMSNEELEFHYFKSHDFDNNTHLDGLEIYYALTHMLPYEENKDKVQTEEHKKQKELDEANYYTTIIDRVLKEDDLDDDGYLSYLEYRLARRRDDEEYDREQRKRKGTRS